MKPSYLNGGVTIWRREGCVIEKKKYGEQNVVWESREGWMKDQVKSVEGNIKSFLSFAYCRRITRIRSKYLMGMKGRLDLKRYIGW